MIDTDKYEGHLMDKAVEHNTQVWCWHTWMTSHTETIEDYNATAALLNDAPLLLAEVQRLRKRNDWLEEVVALLQEDGIDLSMEGYPLWEESE